VRHRVFTPFLTLFVILGISLVVSGCLNMVVDVPPPPGVNQSDPVRNPSEPIQEQPQSAEAALDETGVGVVTVEVLDQTSGLLLDQNINVHLEAFDNFSLVYQETLPLPSSGTVDFGEVPLRDGRVYLASVSYGDVVYRSEITEIGPGASSLSLLVQIVDTTTDDSGLIIDRLHVFIDFSQPDLAQITEIYIFSNIGNATVVAKEPGQATVMFPLPEEASAIGFNDGVLGQRYLETQDGFGDTVSISPGIGIYQVVVNYILPYQGNELDFIQYINYPVGAVVVMTPDSQVKANESYLENLGVQSIPSGTVQVYAGESLERGEELQFRLSGKPESALNQEESSTTQSQSQGYLIGLAIIGVVMFLAGIWLFFRNRRMSELEWDQMVLGEDRDQILDKIIALEDLFDSGEITEKSFLKKRQELKKKLSDLVQDNN